jgi:hypothetical protein
LRGKSVLCLYVVAHGPYSTACVLTGQISGRVSHLEHSESFELRNLDRLTLSGCADCHTPFLCAVVQILQAVGILSGIKRHESHRIL